MKDGNGRSERLCEYCHTIKPYDKMHKSKRKNIIYIDKMCHSCNIKRHHTSRYRMRKKAWVRQYRQDNPDYAIIESCKNADKKRDMKNDLTREFILDTIRNGCVYCGEKEIKMTLDRIDNKIGHMKSNVVPACIRCNLIRRDMPHDAWLIVAKGMREAKELGLFCGWLFAKTGPKRVD
jgi:hypothetical protein